jgi:predicted CXXCH cytochrome family protein
MSEKMIGYSFIHRKKKKILNKKTGNLPGIVSFVVLCALITFPAGYHVLAQESCITSECHANMGKAKYLHGPIAANECKVCHIVGMDDRPPKNHDLSYNKAGKALCFGCHEKLEQSLQGKTNHLPFEEGECIVCHDPHQSDSKFLLTEETLADVCFNCHEDTMTTQNYVHGPVAGGDCIVCHNPHASQNEFLLAIDRVNLCFSCHEDKKEDFEKKYVHQPIKESCEKCHLPHGSQFAYHLKDDRAALCADCHKEFVQQLKDSESQHTAVTSNGCLGCHFPHSSDHSKGLREDKKDLCLSCHEAMKEKILASKYLHGPVEEGDCIACHNPHATDYAKHLVNFFPNDFYFPYEVKNYAMCFGCHNQEVATEAFTETLTDFRNGDGNLHFLHVNREKGRSCKACHEVHAGNQEKHIRREVPYGKIKWMLPIKFMKTETGGNCDVGCHKPQPYDRLNPVTYERN